MVELHLQLSDDIRSEASLFRQAMTNALGNVLLWPGMLFITLIPFQREWATIELFRASLLISPLGTLLLAFLFPIREWLRSPVQKRDTLRAAYGSKRKREASARLALVDNEGELVLESDEAEPKQKQL